MAGSGPVWVQPALGNFHTPSKMPMACCDDGGASSAGRSGSFLGPDRTLPASPMLPPVEPDCAKAASGPDATIAQAPTIATVERNARSRITNSNDRHWISNSRSGLPLLLQSSSIVACRHGQAYHAYRTTALPVYDRVMPENSPSNVAAANHALDHFISAETIVSAESKACAALLATKPEP